MTIIAVTGLVTFKKLISSTTDDWIDKLNHVYTVTILIILATVISTNQFVGDPIFCWVPAEFTNAYEAYTKWYCWIKNTYFVPISDAIPIDVNVRSNAELTYYQWVPLILMFMAFMFKFPHLLWTMMNTHTGLNLMKLVSISEKVMLASKKERDEHINHMAIFLDMWLRSHHYHNKHNFVARAKTRISRVLCFVCNKREGKYLTALYFNIKVFYVVNVICQFYLLNGFLGMDYNSLGYNVLNGLADSENWLESPRFPRVTLCDFRIRQLENIQRYTVQCVLPINLFNEKVFIFLWFWLFFIAVLSCVNLFKWFLLLVMRKNNYMFVRKYLKVSKTGEEKTMTVYEKKLCHRFAEFYLRDDGCFVLRILSLNSSDVVVADLVEHIWNQFKEEKDKELRKISKGQNDDDEYPDVPYIDQETEEH
ncbi:innexin unc-9-like isoform X1 [Ruditapes philippinarum]|uniref:innexin unc-9-like isoform X1 n=1 Tax=Ruditapes philippinarum TaxID=129788 RepID=UPI00295AB3CB|nr:innexin unc-9-like isoform X1 [Ruditapes philippinarum]